MDGTPQRTLHAGSAGLSPCLGAGVGSPRTTNCFTALLQRHFISASVSLPLYLLGRGTTAFQPGKMMPM